MAHDLTEDQYKVASENGVSREDAKQWFAKYGVFAGKAASSSLKGVPKNQHLVDKALENGIEISLDAVYGRKGLGWTDEEITTTEIGGSRRKSLEYMYIKEAISNGISENAYRSRRYIGWSRGRASSQVVRHWSTKRKSLEG